MKIKVNKNNIADIRQFEKDPENKYVRDDEQIEKLIVSYEIRDSENQPPNIEAVVVYKDGVIKSGHSRVDAGLESGYYFLEIKIDISIMIKILLILDIIKKI